MGLITYATKVQNSGATAAGLISAADANEIKSVVNGNQPYKVLAAKVSQTSTNNPVLTIMQNDTGLTFTAQYIDVGTYAIVPSAAPAVNKTWLVGGTSQGSTSAITVVIMNYTAQQFIIIKSYNVNGTPALTDGRLDNTAFEFRIYP